MAVKLGYKKIVVAPYFLFSGKLIDRIYNYVDRVAEMMPNVTFVKAHYLADQDHVINTFVERISEAKAGQIQDSHDLMGAFKARLARGEIDVHHHHAEFQPTVDPEDDEAIVSTATVQNHDTDNGHSHGHSHGVYKHIGHPNGPRTMIDQGVCCCFMSQFPDYIIEEQRAALALAENNN
jgi:sirohydrochlorin cobaltochelatase